ncbi:PAS domain S-box protein [uncultured Winogradskyella sp.]|uniref:PAS domain S-box protein n=1 Tax=uncultured Winogradskyella sp. TaxID=395353 RepID=UPI0030D9C5ED|tara:strand:- start:5641 stop:7620 length:1980 start_codon:yes stop_codon:yes gene_type:complete
MQNEDIEVYKRALAREKASRKAAEEILEAKSAALYETSKKLQESNKKLEWLVKKKTSELQGVFENIVDAYIVMDLWGNVLKMNEAAINLLGYDNNETAFNLLELADISEADNVMNAFETLITEGSVTDFHVKINTKNHAQRLAHINASIIIDENNKPIAAQGIVRDITKEKEAEDLLIESESRLSTLILNLDSGVLLENENREIVLTNNQFCDLFSIPVAPNLLVGQDCSDSAEQSKVQFQNPEEFVSRINDVLLKREVVIADELKMTNGKILERDYIPIFKNSEYKGHLWSYRDVTLKRNYRQSLEAQRAKYQGIIANMNLGLVEVNNDDEILMVNQSFEEISGYTEAEIIGKKAIDVFLKNKEQDVIISEYDKRKEGKSNSYELEVQIKNGETRYWLISGAPNYNINGEVVGSIGIHLDITNLKSLQLQKENLLSKLEKSNDELQEYAHIVSHDLKSPLRSIDALISWIKEDNKEKLDEVTLQNFAHIGTTLEKMEQLISDVLDYSSVGAEDTLKESVDLDVLINELLSILYVPNHITIAVANKLPIIRAYETKLQQLFQNLISNAVKFIDKPEGKISINVISKGDYYEFSVTDNGIGIEQKYHDKIFKIFHSLKKSKESTGIGLSIVKKIVSLHKGEIWLESTPGLGTTFYFTLKK